MEKKVIRNTVRGLEIQFVGYTRALELCARMNYETEVLDFIDAMPKDSVLYDLGACEGRFAMYAAMRGLLVYAFEPEEMNFQAMSENIKLNQDVLQNRLNHRKLAVGSSNHHSKLKIAQPWAGGHQKVVSTAPSRVDLDFNFTAEQAIEVVALDDYIQKNNLPKPDFLKVDVDGSEQPFLEGAAFTLSDKQLKSMMFELCKEDPDYNFILGTLEKHNFYKGQEFQVVPGLFNTLFQRR
jgi:FkbM family methyltransferase